MYSKKSYKKFLMTLPPDQYKKYKLLAKKKGISLQSEIRIVLNDYLEYVVHL